jgi:hypothetical protein
MRRFDEREVISEFRCALGSLDRVLRGFGAGARDEPLPLPGCVAYGRQNIVHLVAR